MTTKELYTKGARVWVPHPDKVWEGAEVLDDYKGKVLRVRTDDDGLVQELPAEREDRLPPLRNPDILIGENDLTSLSYLHEPAVLHNLQVRFEQRNSIYTYCGIVLVAINPYNELPIYSADTIFAYRGQAMGDLDPHIFAVAEEAYTKLEREQRDQSIIVSGESGAGKTVSAKYAMRYFATVGGSATETQVEKKVLASSPIMEAIGNAKTTRNDNSSRFGKFIQIQFSSQLHIQGASMCTYLLEKSRVVFQAPGERNYHIFYQLCSARHQLPQLMLENQDTFQYLNQGGCSQIDGVSDAEQFAETCSALSLLGFGEREQADLWRMLAAILHLGNIQVTEAPAVPGHGQGDDTDASAIPADDPHLQALATLLQLDAGEMRSWLCHRKIVSMREVFFKPMTVEEAVSARDALAKHMYAQMFAWIVAGVNKALQISGSQQQRFIGVLDIYGFETFEVNSFEQFCINYANEKLQQQFNQHVFKLEQEEYVREDISWKFIDFYDNQPCIDLIESRLGILDLLDEECRMPKGTDSSWVDKLYSKCGGSKHFARPRFGNTAFIICHFADKVTYQSCGFLEKNRDTVVEEQINVLRSGQNKLVRRLFSAEDRKLTVPAGAGGRTKVSVTAKAATAPASSKQHKKTVGSQFRNSLNALMSTLNATTPHYVRCIKPNDSKTQFEYNPQRAVQQLRACGVLETIRISAAGFPSRWTYVEFFHRYRVLCHSKDVDRADPRTTCKRILDGVIKEEDKYQFGRTKIFFRAGQVAYLEKLRADKLCACCIVLQKQVRAFVGRRKYLRSQRSVLLIQTYGRGLLARRRAEGIRRERAAVKIQARVRGWLVRVRYQRLRRTALGLQARARGLLARRRFEQMRRGHAATVIQRHVRGWLCRRRYAVALRRVVLVQSLVRRWLARREFGRLKAEARSMEHIKKLNKGLENKIISLQQRIDELSKENGSLRHAQQEVAELRARVDTLRTAESERKKASIQLAELAAELEFVRKTLGEEKAQRDAMLIEKRTAEKRATQRAIEAEKESEQLRNQLQMLGEKIAIDQCGVEERLRQRVRQEQALLAAEADESRNAYQRLLADVQRLETRAEAAEQELARCQQHGHGGLGRGGQRGAGGGPGHQRSLSNASSTSAQDLDAPCAGSELGDDDFGYASVRSTASTLSLASSTVVTASSSRPEGSPEGSAEADAEGEGVALMLKLQHKVRELEKEKEQLRRRLEAKEKDSPTDDLTRARETYKPVLPGQAEGLEMQNAKLKEQIARLHIASAEGTGHQELLSQMQSLQQENERQREECAQLRSVLASHSQGLKSLATASYGSHVDLVNEDGELVLAFEAQKKITRQLEQELREEQARAADGRQELERAREELAKQRAAIADSLAQPPASQTEAFLQHEIHRLTAENLDLQEKFDAQAEQCRRYKRQVRLLVNKLKAAGVLEPLASESASAAASAAATAGSFAATPVPGQAPAQAAAAMAHRPSLVQRKEQRDCLGMFEYRKDDEALIVKHLIQELKPRTAVQLLPGLPAYILFMCIRHTDHLNDEEKVRSLLTATINTIKKVIKRRHEDLDTTVLWLSNTLRLLHNLKQYSGDKAFQAENTPKQNEQCLRNFDLSEYRQVLADIAVWIYQGVIRHLEERVLLLVVPAVLEHEAIAGLSHQTKPGGMRGRLASVDREAESPVDVQKALDSLVAELTSFHRCLALHGVDPELVLQVFRQLFYYICATSLNNLLLRKDLCHWTKGMQIRYNLSYLEQWARDSHVSEPVLLETLAPIIQASQLLQARKTDEDVDSVCEMCNQLSMFQIIKILNLYTPADGFEERVPVTFIRKIQARLQERQQPTKEATLLMDTKFSFSVRFPFTPSKIRLEDIEVPEALNLTMLKKL